MMGGIVLLCLGILGQYLAKNTFNGVQEQLEERPLGFSCHPFHIFIFKPFGPEPHPFVQPLMGVLLSFISFLSIIILTVRELIWPHSAYGWTSLVCVFCMMGGIVLICLGILGQYLAKTYTEVKKRPIYIARERSIKPFN